MRTTVWLNSKDYKTIVEWLEQKVDSTEATLNPLEFCKTDKAPIKPSDKVKLLDKIILVFDITMCKFSLLITQ